MWIDSHAHLTSDAIWKDIDQVIERAQTAGVKKIINICTDPVTLDRGLDLAKRYPMIKNSAATTPHDVEKEGEQVFDVMATAAKTGKLVAVGETGLDYYYTHSAREIQQDFLRRYLQLATECNLPVVIHCREAFDDLFSICDEIYRDRPLILHCFTGTVDEAKKVLERGWMLSLSGIVTFKKSIELHKVAEFVPLNQLLIETDSPYLAPQSKRGKQNEPGYVVEVGEFIAKIKGITVEEVAEATLSNSELIFRK